MRWREGGTMEGMGGRKEGREEGDGLKGESD
jgi:hypothetical protein